MHHKSNKRRYLLTRAYSLRSGRRRTVVPRARDPRQASMCALSEDRKTFGVCMCVFGVLSYVAGPRAPGDRCVADRDVPFLCERASMDSRWCVFFVERMKYISGGCVGFLDDVGLIVDMWLFCKFYLFVLWIYCIIELLERFNFFPGAWNISFWEIGNLI